MNELRRAKAREAARRGAATARRMVDDLDERPEATAIEQSLIAAVRLLASAVDGMADVSEAQDRELGRVSG